MLNRELRSAVHWNLSEFGGHIRECLSNILLQINIYEKISPFSPKIIITVSKDRAVECDTRTYNVTKLAHFWDAALCRTLKSFLHYKACLH